jgi:hypothetical protein
MDEEHSGRSAEVATTVLSDDRSVSVFSFLAHEVNRPAMTNTEFKRWFAALIEFSSHYWTVIGVILN